MLFAGSVRLPVPIAVAVVLILAVNANLETGHIGSADRAEYLVGK